MTITINAKEQAFLNEIISHPLFESLMNEEHVQSLESLQNKLCRKKVDKKATLPILEFKGLVFKAGEGNSSIIMEANKDVLSPNQQGAYHVKVTTDDYLSLFNYFYELSNFYGEVLSLPYHKAYGDSFNVYEKEVERSFDWCKNSIHFLCYTDNETDDHWTRISRSRVREITRMTLSYIFLSDDNKDLIEQLPVEVQQMHPSWIEFKTEKDRIEEIEEQQRKHELAERLQKLQLNPKKTTKRKK